MLAPETYRKVPAAQLVPSAESALALVRGEPGALWAVIAHTLTRAVVMAPAGIAAGAVLKVRPAVAVGIVLAGAVGIEIGVLALAWRQVKGERAAKASVPQQATAQAAAPAALTLESDAATMQAVSSYGSGFVGSFVAG